jgi:heme-degrading monooxygenase HmoA
MILEAVTLDVKAGMEHDFENAFKEAQKIISSKDGYINHQLSRCLEKEGRYLLLVNWQTLEDHTEGFRKSPEYQQWKKLLHHFYDPFPDVMHYQDIAIK